MLDAMRSWRRTILTLALSVVPGAALAGGPAAAEVTARVRAWRQAHETAILQGFLELLSIPNLASDAANIRRNAEHLSGELARRGFTVRTLDDAGGPPAVYGELTAPGARRTVLFYAHYDGQPVTAADWKGEPWRPVLRDGPLEEGGKEVPLRGPFGPEWRLYARSASDDKAPIVVLLAALDALQAAALPRSVNLKVLLEGEEEAGSPHMAALLARHGDLARADLWLLCDGPVHQSRRPQVYFGARGVTDLELTLYGPARPLHSGHYGNWAPNPAFAMATLLAGLRDAQGKILVEGYYDDVRPATEGERRAAAQVPAVESDLRRALALAAGDDSPVPLAEGILQPALNVRGVQSGQVGATAANAVPSEARASIDFRLVPDQTPDGVRAKVEAHFRKLGYTIVHEPPDLETRRLKPRLLLLQWGSGYPAARTSLDEPVARALLTVLDEASGQPVVRMPTLGGSVPMHLFATAARVPVVGLPIVNHDNNQHAANENVRLQNLWDGIELFAAVLARLGPALPGPPGP
jgi:acetylornithine deacetylase/succinyl-diaminopimelate desuccinylase-like protein